ncbi:hypothetical protein FA15DRAFT_459268 [Coprinopsis marcescibilis]|uniref:Uncharacterized protein n=1 Tax=Coprinopsis marcescibilis TaxID=230819 RepID=A0A5C3L5W2_COPMA|nr:hypothetical protein FA15DRAFT_459268 [Coprinopsis marcescibilis]
MLAELRPHASLMWITSGENASFTVDAMLDGLCTALVGSLDVRMYGAGEPLPRPQPCSVGASSEPLPRVFIFNPQAANNFLVRTLSMIQSCFVYVKVRMISITYTFAQWGDVLRSSLFGRRGVFLSHQRRDIVATVGINYLYYYVSFYTPAVDGAPSFIL